MHNFSSSLKKGQIGEEFLLTKWPELQRLDGYVHDFKLSTGETLELKTDSYDHSKTKNFFFERWSNAAKHKPGGPYQALKNGTDLFAYLFMQNGFLYLFDTKKLVDTLEPIVADLKLIDISNKTWTTQGYKVPRALLKEIYEFRVF